MRIAIVGISGYGGMYLTLMPKYVDLEKHPIIAGVDPYPEKSAHLPWFTENKVPVYKTLDEFYANDRADLVIIVSPITFHKEHILTAFKNGSHVLCEKPLTATVQDALEINDAAKKYNKKLGVGFQWSFDSIMQSLKKDILSGMFGKLISAGTIVSWVRANRYYEESSWRGRIKDSHGNWILDSIAANATSHHLHNLFFLLGDKMETAAMPDFIEGSVYRARPIESFDTVFLRGKIKGADLFYTATHVGEADISPEFNLIFENAEILYPSKTAGSHITAKFKDGREKVYLSPNPEFETIRKVSRMIEAIENDTLPDCGVDTILPHLKVCNGIYNCFEIINFPAEFLDYENAGSCETTGWSTGNSVCVKGLLDVCKTCYQTFLLPDELKDETGKTKAPWAAPSVKFSPDEVKGV